MAFDFHTFDVRHNVVWEFGTFGADWSPICGKLGANGLECGGIRHIERESEAVAIFWVDGIDVVSISECSM